MLEEKGKAETRWRPQETDVLLKGGCGPRKWLSESRQELKRDMEEKLCRTFDVICASEGKCVGVYIGR